MADAARSDIRIMSFDRNFQNAHFDIKVINVQADSHKHHSPKEAIQRAEESKNRSYKQRVEKVENASFIPIIFTSRGAKSKNTMRTISKIATKIATKRNEERGIVAKRLATDLSFIFLRMELACIKGHRKSTAMKINGNN